MRKRVRPLRRVRRRARRMAFRVDDRVATALKIIESEFANPPRDGELARRIGVDPSYLRRLFKAATGTSLRQYIRRYRVRRGKAMLRESPALRIGDLADALGYKYVSALDRDFHKCGLQPPRAVRKSQKTRLG